MADQLQDTSNDDQGLVIGVILGLFIFIIGGYYLFLKITTPENETKNEEKTENNGKEKNSQKQQPAAAKTKLPKNTAKKKVVKDNGLSNKLLVASLKGHTANILSIDFSSSGKYLASCSEDRTVRLWHVKDFTEKEHKYSRANVEYDHASSVSFSPDSKAFIVSLATEQKLRVFKIHKEKKEGAASSAITISQEFDFPKVHKANIVSAAISSNGKFIMSADSKTQIIVWNIKGEVLEKIDTLLVYNTSASISPCGSLIAACGFTSGVKLWYITFTKTGDFQQVTKAFDIKGHSAGVLSFSFSNDSKRLATVSKDGTWKIWDINVNYLKGQDAYLLKTGSYKGYEDGVLVQIALTSDYFTAAVSVGTSIYYYDTDTEEMKESLDDVHQGGITALQWSSDSRSLVSAGGVDKMVRVWHNPVGVQATLKALKEKLLKTNSESMKDRIKMQIEEARAYLAKFN